MATLPLSELQPGREYSLFGWTDDNSSSTGSVTFTEAQRRGLAPGQVMFNAGYDEKTERDVHATGSLDEFHASACTS
ncbi:hypothetical protein [Phycicoccus avicenniae]|uniref:hypothetical protein n=1 Tax=Phycicoccus avicenniae TaxID=2828860 RepID=UPI003D2B6EFB